MSLRQFARCVAVAVLVLGSGTGDALAAKPTDAFKKSVESAWRKVPFSRMTGKSGKVQTWGVVLTDGVVTAAPLIRVDGGMTADDQCYVQERVDGAFRVPDVDKQSLKKIPQPVSAGTVMELLDVSFKNEGVVLFLSGPGRDVTRTVGRHGAAQTEWERFCVLLQFSMAPSAPDRLDAADAPKMLSAIDDVIKPFSSRDAAYDFAKTVKKP